MRTWSLGLPILILSGSGGGVLSPRTAPSRPSNHRPPPVCVSRSCLLGARVLGAPSRLGAGLDVCGVCVCVGVCVLVCVCFGLLVCVCVCVCLCVCVSPSLARACACVVLFVFSCRPSLSLLFSVAPISPLCDNNLLLRWQAFILPLFLFPAPHPHR